MLKTASIVEKPWGHEEIWANATRYAGKILFIKEGHRLSRQYHNTKEETIMVLEGQLICEEGPSKLTPEIVRHVMDPGDIFHVSPNNLGFVIATDKASNHEKFSGKSLYNDLILSKSSI